MKSAKNKLSKTINVKKRVSSVKRVPKKKSTIKKAKISNKKLHKKQKPLFAIKLLSTAFVLSLVFIGSLYLKPTISKDILGASTVSGAPSAPIRLVIKANNSTVTLTWKDTSSISADKYIVYRYDEVTGDYIVAPKNQIVSEFSHKYISNENDSGKAYLYKVQGVNLNQVSGDSNITENPGPLSEPVSIRIPSIKTPAKPSKLRVSVKNSLITLTWSGTADGYNIERYDSALGNYISENNDKLITEKNYSNRIYEPGKAYKFRISAYNNIYSSGILQRVLLSPWSTAIIVKVPKVLLPTAPSKLKSTINSNIISLTWDNPSRYTYLGVVTADINGADGYEVMAYSELAKEWASVELKNIRFVSERVLNIYGQTSGVTKKYKIRAYKKIYTEETYEISNIYGNYSEPISVNMP